MPSLAEKKRIVATFLHRCNSYADDKVAQYSAGVQDRDPQAALELQDKILHWTAYRAFNEYALGELAGTELDDWFED